MSALGYAAAGAALWAGWAAIDGVFPAWVRFGVSFLAFTLGPGAAVAAPLMATSGRIERVIFSLAIGIFAGPLLAHVLALVGAYNVFPFAAAAAGGVALAVPRRAEPDAPAGPSLRAVVIVTLVAATLAAGMYANKLEYSPRGIVVYGEYDAFDLTFYASISGELAQHVPAHMPYQSGHRLNYSYYAHLLLGTIHRFADVPLLDLVLRWAWPSFLIAAGLMALLFFRTLLPDGAAAFGAVLMLIGSDFSYVAALVRPGTSLWDPVIWSSNFLSPSAETLLFNTWTPAMCMLLAGLYGLRRAEAAAEWRWVATAAVCFAALVQFKTFAYAAVLGGLAGAVVFAGRDTVSRRRWGITLAGSVLLATPYFYDIVRLYGESQSSLGIDYFLLQRIMLEKLDLVDPLARFIGRLGADGAPAAALTLGIATLLFFVGGLGMRLLGLPHVIRAVLGRGGEPPVLRLTAWICLAGAAIPFVIVTRPYHQTLHFYQTTLFLMWLFVARAVWERTHQPLLRAGTAALVILLAAPSMVHFVHRKWQDRERPAASLSQAEIIAAEYLRGLDSRRTVLLHNRPDDPSLLSILSGRHTVLAWSRYVRHAGERRSDIERFFRSVDGDPLSASDTLAKYRVTHVIEHVDRDAIHPAVLRRLQTVLVAGNIRVYAVYRPR